MSRDDLFPLLQQVPEARLKDTEKFLKGLLTNARFVFGVDLDGVVADFYNGLKPIAAEWMGVDVATLTDNITFGLPEWGLKDAPGGYTALHRFAVTERDLFRSLRPIAGAAQALRRLFRAGGSNTNHHAPAVHQAFSPARNRSNNRMARPA